MRRPRAARANAGMGTTTPYSQGAADSAALRAYRAYAGGQAAQQINAPTVGGISQLDGMGGGSSMTIGAPGGGYGMGGGYGGNGGSSMTIGAPEGGYGVGGGYGAGGAGQVGQIPIPNYGQGGGYQPSGQATFPGGPSQAVGGGYQPAGQATFPGGPSAAGNPWTTPSNGGLPGGPERVFPGVPSNGVGGQTNIGGGQGVGAQFPGGPSTGRGEQSPGIPWQDPNRPNPFMQPGRPQPGSPGYREWLNGQYPNEDLDAIIGSFPPGQGSTPGQVGGDPGRSWYTSGSGSQPTNPSNPDLFTYTNPVQPSPGMPGRNIAVQTNVGPNGEQYGQPVRQGNQAADILRQQRTGLTQQIEPSPGDLNPMGMSPERTQVLQDNGTWPQTPMLPSDPLSVPRNAPPEGNGNFQAGPRMGQFDRPYESSYKKGYSLLPQALRAQWGELQRLYGGAEGNMGGPNGIQPQPAGTQPRQHPADSRAAPPMSSGPVGVQPQPAGQGGAQQAMQIPSPAMNLDSLRAQWEASGANIAFGQYALQEMNRGG